MSPTALIILYSGLGLAMTLLRRRQGADPAAVLLAAWLGRWRSSPAVSIS